MGRTDEDRSFAALLKRYRGAAGLTQEALAEEARISARAVSDLERGQDRTPRSTTLQLLAGALGLTSEQRAEFIAAARRAGRQVPVIPSSAEQASNPPPLPPPPTWLTPLLGREHAEAAIAALLQGGARLVTLTGPGGVGKTRLAAAVATAAVDAFPGGIAFVDLTAVREPARVLPAIAHALGVREEPGRPPARALEEALRGRALLLILDNCEQVAEVGSELVALLTSCPRMQILATSRAALRLQGEQVYPLPPLALPDPACPPEDTEIARAPAVQLFVQRARAARPDFALTPENAAAIVAVCRRLDGLPLALELAAARVRLLPPIALLRHLERDLGVLAGGGPDRPQRHRTIRETIAWSYSLLAEDERALFARLATFAGGAGLEAVEAICGARGGAGRDLLGVLEALVDQSLVLADGADEPRVWMLETIREFAWEQLEASGEPAAVRGRHLAYYLALAKHAEKQLRGQDQVAWLDRLEREHDNLRAALSWAMHVGDGECALQLAAALWRFWNARGYLNEGRGWLEAALSGERGAADVRAGALEGAGVLAFQQGDFGRSAALHEESLALRRALGDTTGIADSLHNLGNVASERGDHGRSATLHAEALGLQRALGDKGGIARSLSSLGIVAAFQGDLGRAMALHGEALALRRALGDTWGIAKSLNNLGTVAHMQGDYERAAAVLEEGLALQRALGDRWAIANSLHNLAGVAHTQGDYGRAAALYEESLALQRSLGDTQGIAASLGGLGVVAHKQGDHGRAAALLEEGLTLQREMGDRWAIANSLHNLGCVAQLQGDYRHAAARHEEALVLRRVLGDRAGIAYSLIQLGIVAHLQGNHARAAGLLEEAFLLSRDVGAKDLVADSLEGLAWVAARRQPQRAARLAGAAAALREMLGVPLEPERRAGHAQAIEDVRAELGEEAFAAAWAAGRAMSPEAAIAYALGSVPD